MNALKTILYMGSTHGVFTFFLPYFLVKNDRPSFDTGLFSYLAIPLWIMGTLIIVWCSVDMVQKGRGTPAHMDPPKQLIIHGLYRYVRNPIYLGALLFQFGYILWFGSSLMIVYFLFFMLTYQILIVLIEEPILRRMFGEQYQAYCRQVPRWIPNLKSFRENV
jgi:protein-S-isoprenylcysteine O-methyltransferase Ste14